LQPSTYDKKKGTEGLRDVRKNKKRGSNRGGREKGIQNTQGVGNAKLGGKHCLAMSEGGRPHNLPTHAVKAKNRRTKRKRVFESNLTS